MNATLPLWLDCSAIALLVDLVRKSIDSLLLDGKNSDKTEVVVSILLESSARHAPHYDWVVAHIGGCFPETVINRVLAVGLKDFTSSAASQMKKVRPGTSFRVKYAYDLSHCLQQFFCTTS